MAVVADEVLVRGVEGNDVVAADEDAASCPRFRGALSNIATCAAVCARHHASRLPAQWASPSFQPISSCSACCRFRLRACRRSRICAPTLSGPSNLYSLLPCLPVTTSTRSSLSDSAADSDEHSRSRHSSGRNPREAKALVGSSWWPGLWKRKPAIRSSAPPPSDSVFPRVSSDCREGLPRRW